MKRGDTIEDEGGLCIAKAKDGHGADATQGGTNILRASTAEGVGTFLLVLVGTAEATAATLGKNTAGPAYDSLSIALLFGLVLVAIVAALGPVSGAHVNPAVTVGLAVTGKFPWRAVPAYIGAQVIGAVVAALAVCGAYGQQAYTKAHLGTPAPVHGSTELQGALVEALIAFLLVFTVMAVATDKPAPAGIAPVSVGFALAAGVLLGGPVSGGAGNPARARGPMLVSGTYPSVIIYILGPLVGGIVGAVLYDRVVGAASTPKAATAVSAPERAPHAAWAQAAQRTTRAGRGTTTRADGRRARGATFTARDE